MGLTFNLGRISPSVFTDSSLNVGIGAAPSGSYKLEVTGTAKVSGITSLTSATASTSTTTGALVVTGGLGIGGALYGTGATFSQDIASLFGIASVRNGSNTQGSGPYFLLSNAASNQLWYQQLNASNNLDFWYNGSVKWTIATTGRMFNSNVTANNYALEVNGSTTTSQSYGLTIYGGTNSSDAALVINNGTATVSNLFKVRGDGNVGIGTASPANKLHVTGVAGNISTDLDNGCILNLNGGSITTANTGVSILFGRTGDQMAYIGAARENGTDNSAFLSFATQTSIGSHPERMRITSGGNVLINTTSDNGYKLQVAAEMWATGYNVANTGGSFQTIDAGGYITLKGATGTGTQNAILFGTNGTEKARITSTGDLQIRNPTFGSYTNTIKLGTYVDYSGGSYIQAGSNPTVTGSTSLDLGTNDGSGILIVNNGSRTIRMASLAGSGSRTVTADASGNLSASSDSSLKQEDKEYKIQGLAEILQLQPRAYKWLSDIEIRGEEATTEIGFFADEVNPIIPSAAPKGNDDLFGFYDRAVIAAMVKAIQELQEQINELKNK
jgi:fibronectin-binding autotransporter adhesin